MRPQRNHCHRVDQNIGFQVAFGDNPFMVRACLTELICQESFMSLRQTIKAALKTAMLAKQEQETGTIRMMIAKMLERDIEVRPSGNVDGIADAEILTMLEGMVKQRRESIALYEKGGRAELAAQEAAEIVVIERFMPQKLSAEAAAAAIAATIAALEAKSIKDMGKVMAALKERYAGQLDFAQAGAAVRTQLSAEVPKD
jgi:uncharacterized protein